MSVKIKTKSSEKSSNGKVTLRKRERLPTQKDIAESLKDIEITPEEQELINASMRAMEAIQREIKRGTFQ